MELIVTLAAWTVQAGAAALLAALLALAASLIPLVRRVKWRKRWAAAGGAVILMLALLCGHPLLRYHKGVESLPPDLQAAVMRYSRGLYSDRLPLVPVWVQVERRPPGSIASWTIQYFCWGTVSMELEEGGWPSVTKPLG